MTANRFRTSLVAACLTLAVAASASAQVFGTFNFQMQPYCNVVTMTITQIPTGYTLDGFDDQCAAVKRASLVGMATVNPDGTVGVTFTIVTAPAGKGVHVSAVISPVTGSGTWTDSVANTGTFVLAGAVPGLPPRPLPTSGIGASVITTTEIAAGAVGGTDINTAEVQARVTGTCAAGQAVTGVNADGTVACAATQPLVQFRAQGLNSEALPSGTRTNLHWSSVTFNDGGGSYSAATGIYTVPTTGLYEVVVNGGTSLGAAGAGTYRFVSLRVNGTIVQQSADQASDTWQSVPLVSLRKLSAGDQVNVSMIHNLGAGFTTQVDAGLSNFSIAQLR